MKLEIAVIDPGYDSYEHEKKLFAENGYGFNVFSGGHHDVEGKLAFAADAVGLLVRWTRVDEAFLERLPNLKAIVRYGVGYDNVDIAAVRRKGIRVANVQSYANNSVSDHALALIFGCSRLLPLRQQTLGEGFGKPPAKDIEELAGKTLGIIGLGRIGGTLCRKAQTLFGRILAVDPYIPAERFGQVGAFACDLDTLLHESDVISLHCNLTGETSHLIDGKAFARMSRRPVLVNTARGPVVDEKALLFALQQGLVHSAGLDVYSEEPPDAENVPLLSHPRVIATGHFAWYSVQASQTLQIRAAQNMLGLLGNLPVEDELFQ